MRKKWIVGLFFCAMIMALFCNNKIDVAAKPAKLYLNTTKKTMYLGQKYNLDIKKIVPATAAKSVTWSSSARKYASVNSQGVVTAKRSGTIYITATCKQNKKVKATCKVKVKYGVKNTSMQMNKKSSTIYEGKTTQLSIKKWKPSNTTKKTVKWTTSNKSIATVNSTGKVTGKKYGNFLMAMFGMWK